jgi:hypothetical protein
MMTLLGSIRLGHDALRENVWLHPGIEPASVPVDDGELYTQPAYVPVAEKRRLTLDECEVLHTRWHWPRTFRTIPGLVA